MRSLRSSRLRLESTSIPQTPQPLQPGMHLSPAAFRVVIAKLLQCSLVHPLNDLIGQDKRLCKPLGTRHRPGTSDLLTLDLLLKVAKQIRSRLWVDLVHQNSLWRRATSSSSVPVSDVRTREARSAGRTKARMSSLVCFQSIERSFSSSAETHQERSTRGDGRLPKNFRARTCHKATVSSKKRLVPAMLR
jgi:hypothetical protein